MTFTIAASVFFLAFGGVSFWYFNKEGSFGRYLAEDAPIGGGFVLFLISVLLGVLTLSVYFVPSLMFGIEPTYLQSYVSAFFVGSWAMLPAFLAVWYIARKEQARMDQAFREKLEKNPRLKDIVLRCTGRDPRLLRYL